MRPPLVVLLAVALAGCGPSRGMMVTGDGRLVPATAETWRAETERVLAEDLAAGLPRGAQVEARIADLPVFGEGRRAPIEGWYFPELHARVVVSAAGAIEPGAVAAAAREALIGKTASRERIHVDVAIAPAAAPSPTAPSPAARSYRAHAGDTLADLSLAFYGTPDLWRVIRDANPTVDFAALRGGETLTIPAKP